MVKLRERDILKHHCCGKNFARDALAIGKLLGVLVVGCCSVPVVTHAADEVLTIAKQGNFYISGKYVENAGDMPMIGQAFVQFQVPQRQTHPYPIVMVHGAAQTGTG
jgi:hypothetical protein